MNNEIAALKTKIEADRVKVNANLANINGDITNLDQKIKDLMAQASVGNPLTAEDIAALDEIGASSAALVASTQALADLTPDTPTASTT